MQSAHDTRAHPSAETDVQVVVQEAEVHAVSADAGDVHTTTRTIVVDGPDSVDVIQQVTSHQEKPHEPKPMAAKDLVNDSDGVARLAAPEEQKALAAPDQPAALPAPEEKLALDAPHQPAALPAPEPVLALPPPVDVDRAIPAEVPVNILPPPKYSTDLPSPHVITSLPPAPGHAAEASATPPPGYPKQLHSEGPQVPTTTQPPAIASTGKGPAVFVGGAPMPMPPVAKPTPDVALHTRGQEAIEYAHLNKQQAEDEHSTTRDGAKLTDKLKTKVHVLEAKMAVSSAEKQLKKDEKKLRKADEATHKKYKQLFPSPLDEPLALFKCTYIDGKAQSSTGFLFVTDSNLRYAGDMADPIRETIPWKTIASVEDVGKPARINVYTVERKVYQFTGIKTAKKGIEDESPHADALNWIDHMWRSTGTAPNPAATYFTS